MASRTTIIPKEQMTPYQRWELASFDEEQALLPEEEFPIDPPPPPPLSEEELDAIRAQAHQEGYDEGQRQGWQAGQQEGWQAGWQQGQQEVRQAAEQLRQIAVSLSTEVSQCSHNIAPELLDLSLDFSKAMLKTALRVKPELLLPTVSAAIGCLPALQLPAHLFLHPADAALVREHMEEELHQHGWRIVEDARLDRGGCRIETATNQVDATTQTRWRRIAEALSEQRDWLE